MLSRTGMKLAGCALLGLTALACGGKAWASDAVPDWVTAAAAEKSPAGNAKAVVLLEDRLLEVDAAGKIRLRTRMVVRIVRPQGREYARPIAYMRSDRKLLSFHVWSISPDGHPFKVKDNQIVEAGSEEWGILYDDVRFRTAEVPGADPGGVVAWESTVEEPLYSGETDWEFQGEIPQVRSVFEADLPAGWQYRALWCRHPSVAPTEVAPNHWRWEVRDVPGIHLDDIPLAPSDESLMGRMTLHYAASPLPDGPALWSRIGDWYLPLAEPKTEAPSEIATESRQLVSPDADFLDRVDKVSTFLQQQIRYVGIEIGVGGYIPHAATDTYRNRYGDCKDKATLLLAMLNAVGVRGTWVMVDTERGVVDAETPSLIGNHMIAAIEIPKGYENPRMKAVVTAKNGQRYLIFDPTNEYVPAGLIPAYLQGGVGILMAGAGTEAVTLPVLGPETSTTERTAEFELGTDGSLKGDVKVERFGSLASGMRRLYTMHDQKETRESLEKSLRSDFPEFDVTSQKTGDVRTLEKPFAVEYGVSVPGYARQAGNFLLLRPRVLGSDAMAIGDAPRALPIEFSGLEERKDTFTVKLPAGYSVDEVPEPVHLETDFATYDSSVEVKSGEVVYHRDYRLKKLELAAGDYATLEKLEGAINADENRSAVLKKP
ncbi:DUF3857 domain-containing protein [Silvibacterium dinghuense]|uniref:DUF3857 domain-containing protein n=1 Tax=Silvibacterium dinghuense TaxID=1560006 RepID=A0A4Q1SHF4_9BACT|nr:DUF3857 domain-containing protein [Silvibacterium dinghuense]RXS96795.1 DUF3857 domain-containing protein [Silvibacterium dinghuense]GGG93701.1 hypothetical protein GCM10011586_05590 [Silvibacterium dinghuense]